MHARLDRGLRLERGDDDVLLAVRLLLEASVGGRELDGLELPLLDVDPHGRAAGVDGVVLRRVLDRRDGARGGRGERLPAASPAEPGRAVLGDDRHEDGAVVPAEEPHVRVLVEVILVGLGSGELGAYGCPDEVDERAALGEGEGRRLPAHELAELARPLGEDRVVARDLEEAAGALDRLLLVSEALEGAHREALREGVTGGALPRLVDGFERLVELAQEQVDPREVAPGLGRAVRH